MEIMEQKDSMIQIQSQNHAKLTQELKDIMKKLDIPHKYQMALLDQGDLGSPKGIMECTSAAECLQEKMETKVHTGKELCCFHAEVMMCVYAVHMLCTCCTHAVFMLRP